LDPEDPEEKKHYEMKDVRGLLGHPENVLDDEDDEMDEDVSPTSQRPLPTSRLPDRGINGAR